MNKTGKDKGRMFSTEGLLMNTTGERQRSYVFYRRPVDNRTVERQRSYVFSIRPVDEHNWRKTKVVCFLHQAC